MKKIGTWIQILRLRTLPLALSSTMLGSFLAFAHDGFNTRVFIFASLTTLFLQILSNLANDYGDNISGADNEGRVGPKRALQQGLITKLQLKTAIIIVSFFSLFCGTSLIFIGLQGLGIEKVLLFFLLGISAIFAAIKYTIGRNPYGYVGFGDLFVFLYFGILGVAGTFYLHTHTFDPWILLPASSIGFLSSGVLNLNNMRDIKNDALTGKKTLVVRIGSRSAKIYHAVIISLSIILGTWYNLKFFNSFYQLLFMLTIPLFAYNITMVIKNIEPKELNNELKKLALSTFAFSLTYGIGLILK